MPKDKLLKVVLVGYMGSGKSTIGVALSEHLKCAFLDLDSYIEKAEGLSIAEIFAQHGEIYFRKKEFEYLKEILVNRDNFVLATGGGTPCYGLNMKEIIANTPNVFYLKLSLPLLVDRLSREKEHRPMIKNIPNQELPEFIGKHLFERSFFYNQAPTTIRTDGRKPQEIAALISEKLV